MKTITEYEPLIFGLLNANAQRRRVREVSQARLSIQVAAFTIPLLYLAAALKIMSDTGMAVWNWQFWVMFVPLFLLGERTLWALSRLGRKERSALARL